MPKHWGPQRGAQEGLRDPETCTQTASLSDQDEKAQQAEKLSECEQILRSGPGGDMSSLLKRRSRPVILTLLLGKQLPLHTGATLRRR